MTNFTTKENTKIHFAHPAYQFAERFEARGTGIPCFQTWSPEETLEHIGEASTLVVSGFWRNEFIENLGALRFVQVCAAGYDQFNQNAISRNAVRLANASGVNVNAVSDHAMALMLGLIRQLHYARDNQRKHHWRGMISDLSAREDELAGRTILIIGMGAIGSRLARLARAFEMKVIGVRRNTAEIRGIADEVHPPNELPSLWGEVDFVALTCPLTNETANIVDAKVLEAMDKSAYLINVARGGCVDEAALIEALNSGQIAGAGIDTTVEEPLRDLSPLWDFDNVILTPHSAGETRHYEENVIDILLENLDRLWRGQTELYNQIV